MKAYSLDLRQRVIDTDRTEMITRKELAARFKVSESFVGDILRLYRETGDVAPKPHGGGHPPTLNPDQLVSLIEIVEKNNDATLDEISRLLEEKEHVFVPRSTMGSLMQRLDLNRKKKTFHNVEKHTEKTQKLRVEYWDVIRNVTPENLIFIDESGVNLAMVRMYARAFGGERARGAKPQKTQNVSIIGAISLEGMIASYNILGGVKKMTFEAFICAKLVPVLKPGNHVMMDNATGAFSGCGRGQFAP
jgi:transposase